MYINFINSRNYHFIKKFMMKSNVSNSELLYCRIVIVLSLVLFNCRSSVAQTTADPGACYATTGHTDGGRLLKIDPATGSGTLIGSTGLEALPGVSINSSGEIYAVSAPDGDIYILDAGSASAELVVTGNPDLYVKAIAFDSSDVLYASTVDGDLYTIDLDTGYALIGNTGHELSGLAFDPVDNTLWGSEGHDIYTIDPATAAITLIGESGVSLITDLAFDPAGNLYACYGGNSSKNYIVSINKSNGEGSLIGEIGFQTVSGLAFYKVPAEPIITRTIRVTPDNIELGYVDVDSSSSIMLTVKSIGTASLTITDISDPGEPFGLTNLPDMPAVLSPDSSITFDVTFSPADTGTFNSTFSVISNDDENPEFEITVNAKGFTIHPAQPGVCYATLAYSNPVGGYSGLISIDPESGAGTLIGETGLRHIAINSKGEIYGLGPGNRENYPAIYRVDALSGGSRFVMDPDIRATWSMAFDQNDLLYIMGGSSKHFYSIDLTSGTVNDIGAIRPGIAGDILWDMAFDPITGTLWAIDGFYYIYKIDPSTAEMTWVGDTKVYSLDGLGFDVAGNLYAVTTGSSTSGIYSIDKSTGIASPIGDIGFWPVIDFSFFNVPVEGKHLSVTSRNIDFGSIDVNGIRSMPVTIGNYGTEDMIVTDISVPDAPFSVDQLPTLPLTMPPFTSKLFTITFAPEDSGTFNSSITISSDDEDNLSLDIVLGGDGFVLKAAEPEALYTALGTSHGGALILIDPTTGEGTITVSTGMTVGAIRALAINSVGKIYGANDRGFIYKIDAATPGTSVLFTSNLNIILQGMAFNNNDVLYGTNGENLYLIDPQNGYYNIGPTGVTLTGLSFDPTDGTLWGSDADNIYTIDTLTAVASLIGNTNYSEITDLSFDALGNLYATQLPPYSPASNLISINKSTGEGALIGTIGTDWGIECLAFNQVKDVSDILDMKNVIPMVYALKQNYPNPFNASTTIAYDLPVAGKVELAVYDILGKKVATLVNDHQTAGKHAVEWDAIGQSSGLYFYQIKAGDFLKIKKCILLK